MSLRSSEYLLLSIVTSVTPSAWGNPPASAIEEIRGHVTATRDRIADLEVVTTYNAVSGPEGIYNRFTRHIVLTPEAWSVERRYSQGLREQVGPEFRTVDAWDGTHYLAYDSSSRVACQYTDTKRIRRFGLEGQDFIDINLLGSPKGGNGYDDHSLVSLVLSPMAVVREEREQIDGIWCDVVDLVDARFGEDETLMSVWLDPERGHLPVYQLIYSAAGGIRSEVQSLEAEEALPGLWLTTVGRQVIHAIPGDSLVSKDIDAIMEVAVDPQGMLQLWVSETPVQRDFTPEALLPVGTSLIIDGSDEIRTIARGNVRSMAEDALAQVPRSVRDTLGEAARIDDSEVRVSGSAVSTFRRVLAFGAPTVISTALCVLAYRLSRRTIM